MASDEIVEATMVMAKLSPEIERASATRVISTP